MPPISRFLTTTLLALMVCMPVWYFTAAHWAQWPIQAAGWVLQQAFSWATDVSIGPQAGVLKTNLQAWVRPAGQGLGHAGVLNPEADHRLWGYGLPLLWALLLASRPPQWGWHVLWGTLCIGFMQSVSMALAWLHQVFVPKPHSVAAMQGLPHVEVMLPTAPSAMWTEALQFAFHFNLYVWTPLLPLLLWMAMDKQVRASVSMALQQPTRLGQ